MSFWTSPAFVDTSQPASSKGRLASRYQSLESDGTWHVLTINPSTAHSAMSKTQHSLQVFCRIDYHLATPALAATARAAAIYKDQRFSDHAPLTIDYDFTL